MIPLAICPVGNRFGVMTLADEETETTGSAVLADGVLHVTEKRYAAMFEQGRVLEIGGADYLILTQGGWP